MGRGYRVDAKRTAESCFSLDIHWLKKQGYLKAGGIYIGTCTQSFRLSKRKLETRITSDGKQFTFTYTVNNERLSYVVPIVYSRCNYGGERPWFQCPNKKCNKRVGKLFLSGKYYLCRHCHNLAYETQNMSDEFRLLEAAQNIRYRLGAKSLATIDPFPPRPKGMHNKTYMKLWLRYHNLVDASWGVAAQKWGFVI